MDMETHRPRREPLCEIPAQILSVEKKPARRGRPKRSSIPNPDGGTEAVCRAQQCFAIETERATMECVPQVGVRRSPRQCVSKAGVRRFPESAPETCAHPVKAMKRKRALFMVPPDSEAKVAVAEDLKSEMASLVKYYHEDGKLPLALDNGSIDAANATLNRAEIAVLLEESDLPFSSLVAQIFEKLRAKDSQNGGINLTLASIRSTVLSVAERINFGVANADADVLEDNADSSLWCWEVRDLKLLPEAQRNVIAVRRRRRRKISERLSALSAMISLLGTCDHQEVEQLMLSKAKDVLAKTDNEASIRVAVVGWLQKMDIKLMAKEAKVKEKEAIREQHRIFRENEKERRRHDKEAEKQRLQQEKEKEKSKKEVSKEQARAHKEATRQEKELKRQQDEAEKEQRRKEKEASELKKQAALQKQANIMDRFLQFKKDSLNSEENPELNGNDVHQASLCGSPHKDVTSNMDQELGDSHDRKLEDLFSFHAASWQKIGQQCTAKKFQRWGCRRLPKVAVVKELRLQGGSDDAFHEGSPGESQSKNGGIPNVGLKRSRQDLEDDELRSDKVDPEWDVSGCLASNTCFSEDARTDAYNDLHYQNKRRKLLQFDKSHRPAYYGTFSKKSNTVGPRNPFKKDPSLDYENDSDEEWEEEDPGESLSDCDKDDDEEKVDIEDDDDNADGFVVPDGYLSENEGVNHLEDPVTDDETDSSPMKDPMKYVPDNISEPQLIEEQDLRLIEKQHKLLDNVTEQALRSNRAFTVSNLINQSIATFSRTERSCLQALRIRVITPDIPIEPPLENSQKEKPGQDNQRCKRPKKGMAAFPDSALSEMVEVMLSCPQGMKKTVDILSRKFPNTSRLQLKNKVREISDFVDNHWQVKQEIVEQLGLRIPSSPAPTLDVAKIPPVYAKPITKFFSKRCLPAEENGISDQSP